MAKMTRPGMAKMATTIRQDLQETTLQETGGRAHARQGGMMAAKDHGILGTFVGQWALVATLLALYLLAGHAPRWLLLVLLGAVGLVTAAAWAWRWWQNRVVYVGGNE